MNEVEFGRLLTDQRPALHRYCARMTGSTIDGEDVVQDVLIRALKAHAAGAAVENHAAWLFRVAHNACLDFLRMRSRRNHLELTEQLQIEERATAPEVMSYSFRTFLRLPELQRAAVILKDVLGHSTDEIAAIAGCSAAAAKSALQRGRAALRTLADNLEDAHVPPMSEDERRRLHEFVTMFRAGNFDAVRRMLADDVRLDLVARLELRGRDKIEPYFARYAEAPHWRFSAGAIDGRLVMLVFDMRQASEKPNHYVEVAWRDRRIAFIRDSLFTPYAMEAAEWLQLG